MRIYVFAMLRGRWFTQCLDATDLKTSVSGFRYFDSFETLLKALSYLGVPDDGLAAFAKRTDEIGKGSVELMLEPGKRNLLGIHEQFRERARWTKGCSVAPHFS